MLFLPLKMSQSPIDDVLVLDTSDDSDRLAAAAADFDVYIEYSLESLRPGHGGVALGGVADFCVGDRLDAFPAPGWRDEPAPAVVWCEDTVEARHGHYLVTEQPQRMSVRARLFSEHVLRELETAG